MAAPRKFHKFVNKEVFIEPVNGKAGDHLRIDAKSDNKLIEVHHGANGPLARWIVERHDGNIFLRNKGTGKYLNFWEKEDTPACVGNKGGPAARIDIKHADGPHVFRIQFDKSDIYLGTNQNGRVVKAGAGPRSRMRFKPCNGPLGGGGGGGGAGFNHFIGETVFLRHANAPNGHHIRVRVANEHEVHVHEARGPNARWLVQKHEGHIFLKNKKTGKFLNFKPGQGGVLCTGILGGDKAEIQVHNVQGEPGVFRFQFRKSKHFLGVHAGQKVGKAGNGPLSKIKCIRV